VTLSDLKTNEERKAFFLNIYNSLSIHARVHYLMINANNTEDLHGEKRQMVNHQIGYMIGGSKYTLSFEIPPSLYTFGQNNFGQLGRKGDSERNLITLFIGKKILSVRTVLYSTIVQTDQGSYGFGLNDRGNLGIGNNKNQSAPQLIPFFNDKEVISISCGSNHTIILTDTAFYAFGSNTRGQLGIGTKIDAYVPVEVNFFREKKIITITCGQEHTLVLTDNGLYGFGNNDSGQLGIGHNIDANVP